MASILFCGLLRGIEAELEAATTHGAGACAHGGAPDDRGAREPCFTGTGRGLEPFWEVPDDGEGTLTGGESRPRPEGSLGRGYFHRG